jgi:PAS domain S-box-containing protein
LDRPVSPGLRRPFTRSCALLGLSAAALGIAVLLVRAFDAAVLESTLGLALHGVRSLTGLALLLGGLAFAALHRVPHSTGARALAIGAALAVAGIGCLGLFAGPLRIGALMSIPIGVAMVLIGVGAAWAALRPYNSLTAQLAGGAAFGIALLVLLGRVYSARPLYEIGDGMPARPGAALGCALLALALLLARPEYALSRVLAGRSLGADHLRRSLPALLGVPLATGLLTLAGLRVGWYGEHVAFALFTALAMLSLGLLGISSARRIDAIAAEREVLEGLFRRTFDNASVGVARLDGEGRWLHVNACLAEIVGWPREELIGRSFAEITHPDDLPFDREVLAAFARGEFESQRLEKRYVTKQGHPVWVELFASAERGRDGRVESFVAVVQDIGARKRAERAKDEFFALVSHELRSPLHVLGGWLAVLRQEADPERRRRALETAERSAALLGRLIGDLLDASRIASGKLEIEREVFDLQELVRAVVAAFQPLAASRELTLELELPAHTPFVSGDPERIEQVVRNLLDNALKFTEPGGRVRVQLARAGGRATIAVSDTGRGIAPELLPRVFERLTQGEGGPRGADRGLGLGLSIVRHLVELHGGAIEARSAGRGRGACFVVTLPEAAIPQQLAPLAPPDESDALDGVHVLVVKPDRSAAEALALALEAADASIEWVRAPDEGLARARQRPPRAVVVDLDVEPDDWAEWLRGLRTETRGPLAAVALSAGDHAIGRRRARAAGFDAFVGRPVDPRRLVATLQGVLEGPHRVLVVDDEPDAADSLAILLGFLVERAYAVEQALAAAARFQPHAVVTDLQLGGEDGADLARALRKSPTGPQRIVALTGRAPGEGGIEVELFDGVAHKPVDLDALLVLLRGHS